MGSPHTPNLVSRGQPAPPSPLDSSSSIDPHDHGGMYASHVQRLTRSIPHKYATIHVDHFVDGRMPYIKDWPAKPTKPNQWNFGRALGVLFDIVSFITPLAFAALAISAWHLNGQSTLDNSFGRKVERAMQIGPTVFPIVFAALVGRFLKTSARAWAESENGQRLGVLELLTSSKSVFATIESQFVLGKASWFGAGLLLLWACSPLGGQASLRVLRRESKVVISQELVRYLPTGYLVPNQTKLHVLDADTGEDWTSPAKLSVTALFTSALLSGRDAKIKPQDGWGNIRIPRIETISRSKQDADGWLIVAEPLDIEDYVTFTGLPMSKITVTEAPNSTAVGKFAVEYEYTDLQCSDSFASPEGLAGYAAALGFPWTGVDIGHNLDFETNYHSVCTGDSECNVLNFDAGSMTISDKSIIFGFRNVRSYGRVDSLPQHWTDGSDRPMMTVGISGAFRNCSMEQIFLEAQVGCSADGCAVNAMRPSTYNMSRDPYFMPFESSPWYFAQYLAAWFPSAFTIANNQKKIAMDSFVRGADGVLDTLVNSSKLQSASQVPNDRFSKRMSILYNTYLQLGQDPMLTVATGVKPANDSTWDHVDFEDPGGFTFQSHPNGPQFNPMNATATISTSSQIYRINLAWIVLLLTISIALSLCSLANLGIGLRLRAPDMMGYVASQTYDNPFVPLPASGSAMDAGARANLLFNMRVKIGNVKPADADGHIAFAAQSAMFVGNVRKNRLYF